MPVNTRSQSPPASGGLPPPPPLQARKMLRARARVIVVWDGMGAGMMIAQRDNLRHEVTRDGWGARNMPEGCEG